MNNVDSLLQRMVQFDTVNTGISGRADAEKQLADWLDQTAQNWGFETRRFSMGGADQTVNMPDLIPATEQLLITCRANANAPWILFDSHMDTVATDGMTIDPFAGEIRNEKLYGRGSCDTKGTGAAMLWALHEYARNDDRPNNVALLFSVDEELTMTGIRSFIRHDLPTLGFEPSAVIVGEPTMHQPVIAHNGLVRWNVTTRGVAAHSAAPYLGRSAISMMSRIIEAIESNYIAKLDAEDQLTGRAVCVITKIHGGTQVNIVPDHCEIDIDRRLVPGESADIETEKLRDLVTGIDPDCELQTTRLAPPLDATSSADFLPIVQAAIDGAKPIGAPFATHAGDLCLAGLPVLVIGPGDPRMAHTKDEWVSLVEIRKGVDIYQRIMQSQFC